MSILLSPHDDDSALFASYTCMREKPTVVIVADSYVQPARGELGCSAEVRAAETAEAHRILGCTVVRLGLRDDDLTVQQIISALDHLALRVPADEFVYVPALEGGHPQHDMTAIAAAHLFGWNRLRCYSTYSRHGQYAVADLSPLGTQCVDFTQDELATKRAALACYQSQWRINRPHFVAVEGNVEWLSGYNRIHLGCGEQLKAGWINIDRKGPATGQAWSDFVKADLEQDPIPMKEGSADFVFSEDFLEHLPPGAGIQLMNEIWRVLVPGGIMEHYVPNAGSQNDFGSPSHLSHWNWQCFEHFDVNSYRWKKDRAFESIVGGFERISAQLGGHMAEDDGVTRAQSLHVRYRAVK